MTYSMKKEYDPVWPEFLLRFDWAEGLGPIELMAVIDNRWDDLDPIAVQRMFRLMAGKLCKEASA